MGRQNRVNLFMPTDGADLSIYKRMLEKGIVRPFEMPDGVEQLASRVMRLMEIAEETGRTRDALKAAEIVRMLMADNRAIALELDKIVRLDAGKPTSIAGHVDPQQADRIKRIISTQRARPNTETIDGEASEAAPRHEHGADGGGEGGADQGSHSPNPARRDRQAEAGSGDAGTAAGPHGDGR